jgi:hypothetical protein
MELTLIERAIESSPAVVIILLAACIMLWRTLREEIASCRSLHAQSIESQQRLASAIEQLSKRIDGAR